MIYVTKMIYLIFNSFYNQGLFQFIVVDRKDAKSWKVTQLYTLHINCKYAHGKDADTVRCSSEVGWKKRLLMPKHL